MDLDIRDIEKLVEGYPGEISVYRVREGRLEPLYHSAGAAALSGMTEEEYEAAIAGDASQVVLEADRELVAREVAHSLAAGVDAEVSYRIVHRDRGFAWVHAKARRIGTMDGCPVLLTSFLDTAAETDLHEELLDRTSEAVMVCELSDFQMLYVNRAARTIWGCEGDYTGRTCYDFLHGRSERCPWCGLAHGGPVEKHYDELREEDTGRYLDYDRQRVSWHGRDAFAVFAEDITERRRTQAALLDEKRRLESIIEHVPAGVCVFEVRDDHPSLIAANGTLRAMLDLSPERVPDITGPQIASHVHPDDRASIQRLSAELMGGAPHATCEFRVAEEDGAGWRWLHLNGAALAGSDGSTFVFGAVTDITARRAEEERYARSVDGLLTANPQTICVLELDLTRNVCSGGRGVATHLEHVPAEGTADDVFAGLFELVADEDDLAECRRVFDRAGLLAAFSRGEDRFSVDYRRRTGDGRSIWARTYLTMVCNPLNGDVEAVTYSEDIDDRRRRDIARHIATEAGYEYIALIDLDDSTVSLQEIGSGSWRRTPNGEPAGEMTPRDYGSVISAACATWVHAEDRERFLSLSALSTITAELEQHGHYEYVLRGPHEGGERRKRMQYAWLDDSHRTVVVWQTDITEAVHREQEDAERLSVALSAAKQASNAKSVFLSRMSHEIRTPMNAIIGMDTLAMQALGDDEKVADCLSKIGISSRYLLSLINDILDMSRIESGKMELRDESFLLRDLITSTDDLMYGQATAKGLDYECVVGADAAEAYRGDSMKLQQILVNLLGNAIKFTERGRVSLSVQQISRSGSHARLRFIVSDTGQGIGEADQQRIFEPFEQADDSNTTVFGGTGLGLAITRNLVELMGGSIRLRSILGVGSEFTVEVPLDVDETISGTMAARYRFEDMSALVVDDDLISCEQADRMLKDIGIVSEWVTSGVDAVERVRTLTEQGGRFDFILIDWKMPEMDGIETTHRIRRIVGPDVTIIIISAYDWQSIEVEARAAGADLLISKPLFRSTLVSAFRKAHDAAEEAAFVPSEADFTGRRALVAEDNAINAEIAKSLLENRGFQVELAGNGLKALEMFTQSPVGYYDVILMDVRMPKMDGLQAASNIRDWDKPDAKTVPIVAMTANAFDEDVEKSRAAGMDAHLAKPIDPDLMYRTLQRVMTTEQDD